MMITSKVILALMGVAVMALGATTNANADTVQYETENVIVTVNGAGGILA